MGRGDEGQTARTPRGRTRSKFVDASRDRTIACSAGPRATVTSRTQTAFRVPVDRDTPCPRETAAIWRQDNTNHPASAGAPPLHPEFTDWTSTTASRWTSTTASRASSKPGCRGSAPTPTRYRGRLGARSLRSPTGTIGRGSHSRETRPGTASRWLLASLPSKTRRPRDRYGPGFAVCGAGQFNSQDLTLSSRFLTSSFPEYLSLIFELSRGNQHLFYFVPIRPLSHLSLA